MSEERVVFKPKRVRLGQEPGKSTAGRGRSAAHREEGCGRDGKVIKNTHGMSYKVKKNVMQDSVGVVNIDGIEEIWGGNKGRSNGAFFLRIHGKRKFGRF